jgi:hypothetical protein
MRSTLPDPDAPSIHPMHGVATNHAREINARDSRKKAAQLFR